MKEITNYRN